MGFKNQQNQQFQLESLWQKGLIFENVQLKILILWYSIILFSSIFIEMNMLISSKLNYLIKLHKSHSTFRRIRWYVIKRVASNKCSTMQISWEYKLCLSHPSHNKSSFWLYRILLTSEIIRKVTVQVKRVRVAPKKSYFIYEEIQWQQMILNSAKFMHLKSLCIFCKVYASSYTQIEKTDINRNENSNRSCYMENILKK